MDVGKYLADRTVKKGECWIWQQCVDKASDLPIVSVEGKKNLKVRRWAYQKVNGITLTRKKRVIATCLTPRCVNPDHLEAMTHTSFTAFMVQHGRMQGSATWRRDQITATRAKRSPLTMADAVAIRQRRDAGELCTVLAKEYGVAHATISKIHRGIRWKDITPVASVFTWRPQ